MIKPGGPSISVEDILKVTSEAEIANHYLGVTKIPCKINSPLREDKNPSFGLFSPDGNKVTWRDFSSGEKGGIFDLLSKMWNIDFNSTLQRIFNELNKKNVKLKNGCYISYVKNEISEVSINTNKSKLECKVREWRKYDIEYWKSYGISLKWLKYANVYPISHKIIIKDNKKYTFGADRYAYAYAEFKDGITTLKIYQPFNKNGFKWCSKHDKSVISLWTKVPKEGERICICSSLKDALCLWSNTSIPSIAIQGEGYNISNTAINELKRRFKKVYILLDNDPPGLKDSELLASKTGFTNIILPRINNCKDISDLYKSLNNKQQFISIIKKLFN